MSIPNAVFMSPSPYPVTADEAIVAESGSSEYKSSKNSTVDISGFPLLLPYLEYKSSPLSLIRATFVVVEPASIPK